MAKLRVGVAAMGAVLAACAGATRGAADGVDATHEVAATSAGLAACARLYDGFESCCRFDADSQSWTFIDSACPGAVQCLDDVDCPAGWVEQREHTRTVDRCLCVPGAAGTCTDEVEEQVAHGESCLSGLHRCPLTWPDRGPSVCSSCACETRDRPMIAFSPTDCPADFDIDGCPCTEPEDVCCFEDGSGLACYEGVFGRLWDAPCRGGVARDCHRLPD